jgi:hypothetical protein
MGQTESSRLFKNKMGVAVLLLSVVLKGPATLHFGFNELGHAMQANLNSAL